MFLIQKPSPFLSTTNKNNSSHIPNPYLLAAQLFDHKILLHLKTLPSSNSNITLSWLSSAVTFLSTVHTEAEDQISNLKLKSVVDDYQDLYMDYSIKVLELCNIISSGVRQLTERRRLMNFSLRLLNFTDEVPSLEKLNKALDIFVRSVGNTQEHMKEKEKSLRAKAVIEELSLLINKLPRGNTSAARDLIRRTLHALGLLTVFVGGVLVNVLYGEVDAGKLRVPAEFMWADSVNGVHDYIDDLVKVKDKGNVVLEVDDVAKQAGVMRDLVQAIVDGGGGDDDNGVRVCLKELALLTKKFSDGLDGLTNGVSGLFHNVLETRNGGLGGR